VFCRLKERSVRGSYRDKRRERRIIEARDLSNQISKIASYTALIIITARCVNYLVLSPAFLLAAPPRGNPISQTCFVLRPTRRQGGGTQTCEAQRRPLAPVRIGLLLFKSADRRVVWISPVQGRTYSVSLDQSRSAPLRACVSLARSPPRDAIHVECRKTGTGGEGGERRGIYRRATMAHPFSRPRRAGSKLRAISFSVFHLHRAARTLIPPQLNHSAAGRRGGGLPLAFCWRRREPCPPSSLGKNYPPPPPPPPREVSN